MADTGQYDVLLQNGEVDLMLGSLGRSGGREEGLPSTTPSMRASGSRAIDRAEGRPPEMPAKLLAWMSLPDVEANFVDLFPVGVPEGYALMKPDVAANLPTAGESAGALHQRQMVDG